MNAPLPMFPLGTVLLPSMMLPLQVFEPRYRALMDEVMGGDEEFGVVLIERGFEVGGGDVRTSVGTVAKILEAEQFADGRWMLVAVGTRRLAVDEWLDDRPFPNARVSDFEDLDETTSHDGLAPADHRSSFERALAKTERVYALHRDLGADVVMPTIEFSEDIGLGSFQLIGIGPHGPHDRQRLLEQRSVAARLVKLEELLDEELVALEQRRHGWG